MFDDCAYFSNWFYNGFFKVEINTGKTTFLGHFNDEKISEANVHKEIFLKNNKIYFCPRRGRHVHIYNLSDQSLHSVEIKKASENYFYKSIILEEDKVFLIPEHKELPVKTLDLELLEVATIDQCPDIYCGKDISEYKDIFPRPDLVEKYHVERGDGFFWRRVPDGSWYGFLPIGCALLQYVEGTDEFQEIPLVVTNKENLRHYLYKVRESLLEDKLISEEMVNLQEYLEAVTAVKNKRQNDPMDSGSTRADIWLELKKADR